MSVMSNSSWKLMLISFVAFILIINSYTIITSTGQADMVVLAFIDALFAVLLVVMYQVGKEKQKETI